VESGGDCALCGFDGESGSAEEHAAGGAHARAEAARAAFLDFLRARAQPLYSDALGLLERLKREQDFVLLDTAPHDDTDAKLAIRGADLVLVPLQPSAADLWSMDATLDIAKQEKRPFRLLLNRAPASGKLRDDIEGQIRDRNLPMLDAVLGNRTAYAQAFMAGLGVVETAPRGPAAAEVRALASALEAICKKGLK
jgi:chromosome partitioning protein